jgi:hypothetical protein
MPDKVLGPAAARTANRARGASLGSVPRNISTAAECGKAWLEVAAERLRRRHGLTAAIAVLTASLAGLGGAREDQ